MPEGEHVHDHDRAAVTKPTMKPSGAIGNTLDRTSNGPSERSGTNGSLTAHPFPTQPEAERSSSFVLHTSSGPLPPPQVLVGYQQIPGAAEQILAMARDEQAHRHAMERAELDLERRDLEIVGVEKANEALLNRRGQGYGLIVCLVVIGAATAISIFSTSPYAPFGGAAAFGLAGIVSVFMRGKHPKQDTPPKAIARQVDDR